MRQPLPCEASGLVTAAGTNYARLVNNGAALTSAQDIYAYLPIPTNGSISNLHAKLSAAPGVGISRRIRIFIGGVSQEGLEVTISGTDTTGADEPGSVSVTAGQLVCYEIVTDGNAADATIWLSCDFTSDTEGESICIGGINSNKYQANYGPLFGIGAETGVAYHSLIMPTSGTFSKLYVSMTADPGTSPDAYTITFCYDGGTESSLAVTIVADGTTGNDLVNSKAVIAGQDVVIKCTPVSSPAITPYIRYGLVFTPSTNGYCLLGGGTGGALSTSDAVYNYASGAYSAWSATENLRYMLLNTCRLRNLYTELSGAPGSGKSYTISVRQNGASPASGLSVAISGDSDVAGNDVANTISIANGDTIGIMSTPAGTPTSRTANYGLVADTSTGWSAGKPCGIASPGKVLGVANASIGKVIGV